MSEKGHYAAWKSINVDKNNLFYYFILLEPFRAYAYRIMQIIINFGQSY